MAFDLSHVQVLSNISCLPYELERGIFELTAKAYPGTAAKLALVSSYTREWMEAFIYEVIILDLPFKSIQLFLRTFHERPRSFFSKTVKHLYLTSIIGINDSREIIAACTNACTVACWVDVRPNIDGLRRHLPLRTLQRLSMKIETMWGYTDEPSAYRFLAEDFPFLTHLEIVNPPGYSGNVNIDWEGICQLPSLTHFRIGDLWAWDHLYTIPAMEDMFRRCPKLQAIAAITHDTNFISALQAEEVYKNPRLIVLPHFHWPISLANYWTAIKSGVFDGWEIAEKMYRDHSNVEAHTMCCFSPGPSSANVLK